MLEAYALRWSIEVYFKEAKQHLGFLKEQTITFVSHTASIHLCAIRYLMLMSGKLNGPDSSLGELRENIQDQLNSMCFATHLWQIFRAIVGGTLKSLSKQLAWTIHETPNPFTRPLVRSGFREGAEYGLYFRPNEIRYGQRGCGRIW